MIVRVRRIAAEEGPLLRELRVAALREAPEAFGESLAEAEAPDADSGAPYDAWAMRRPIAAGTTANSGWPPPRARAR